MRNCELGDVGHIPKSNYVHTVNETEIHHLNTDASGWTTEQINSSGSKAKQRNTSTTSWVAKAIFTQRLIRIWRNANEFWKIFKLKFNYNRFGYWGIAQTVFARPAVLGMMEMCLTAVHPVLANLYHVDWIWWQRFYPAMQWMLMAGRRRESGGAGKIHFRQNGQQTKWTVIDIINRNIIYFQMNKLLTDLGVTVIAVFLLSSSFF